MTTTGPSTGTTTTLSWDDFMALWRPGRGTVTIDGDTIVVVGDGPLPELTIDPVSIDPLISGPALVATDVTIDRAPAPASEAFGVLLSDVFPSTAAGTIHITTAGTISLPPGATLTPAAVPTLDTTSGFTATDATLLAATILTPPAATIGTLPVLGVAPGLLIHGPLWSVVELPLLPSIALPNFIFGTAGDDVLYGTEGADWIGGGVGGTDQCWGGAGDDTYIVDDVRDLVLEFAGQGTDTVRSSIDVQIADDVENLVLDDSAVTGIGNRLDNLITANNRNSDNTAIATANILFGGAGDDTIDGGAGGDHLWGGEGDDTFVVDDIGDVVIEYAGQGTDTIRSSIDVQLADDVAVENLVLTGTAVTGIGNSLDNHITGTESHNVLYGGAGDDMIDGGAGADHMWGGEGDDTFVVDDIGDVVIEVAGQGIDTIRSSISLQIADDIEVENLVLGGTAATGIGNSLGNVITGNAGDNLLDGRAGDDTLDGGAGMDLLIGGAGNDTFVFKAGYGRDFVDGFAAGEDVIAVSTDLFADYAAAMATAVQACDDVVFAIDADTTLTLWHTQLSALTADDFRFV